MKPTMQERIESLRKVVAAAKILGILTLPAEINVLSALLSSSNQTLPIDEGAEGFDEVRGQRDKLIEAIGKVRDILKPSCTRMEPSQRAILDAFEILTSTYC